MVKDVLTEDVRDDSLMELLYSDYLALWGEPLNEVMEKYVGRKITAAEKGLRVNVSKKTGMQILFGKKSTVWKVDLCGFCGEQVAFNFVQCTKCQVGSSLLF